MSLFPKTKEAIAYPESLGSNCCESSVYELDGVIFCKACGVPAEEVFETEEEEEDDDEGINFEEMSAREQNEADFKCDSIRDSLYE